MQKDNEQLYVAFHHQANNALYALLENFESSTAEINRQTEEYRFQQTKETFVNTFKQQLEGIANQLMQDHGHHNRNELSQNLQQFIKQYLHLFVQKTRTT